MAVACTVRVICVVYFRFRLGRFVGQVRNKCCASVQREKKSKRICTIYRGGRFTVAREQWSLQMDGWMDGCVCVHGAFGAIRWREEIKIATSVVRFCFGICGHIDKVCERIKCPMNQAAGHFFRLICVSRFIPATRENKLNSPRQLISSVVNFAIDFLALKTVQSSRRLRQKIRHFLEVCRTENSTV